MDRVQEKITAKSAPLTQEKVTAVLGAVRFLVKDGEKEILLPVEMIDWVEAPQYYFCLHSDDRSYMLRETISDLNASLDPRRSAHSPVGDCKCRPNQERSIDKVWLRVPFG